MYTHERKRTNQTVLKNARRVVENPPFNSILVAVFSTLTLSQELAISWTRLGRTSLVIIIWEQFKRVGDADKQGRRQLTLDYKIRYRFGEEDFGHLK